MFLKALRWSPFFAGLTFFIIPWGLLLIVLPYVLTRAFAPRVWPLALSVLLLALGAVLPSQVQAADGLDSGILPAMLIAQQAQPNGRDVTRHTCAQFR